jgi:hypothetical protein
MCCRFIDWIGLRLGKRLCGRLDLGVVRLGADFGCFRALNDVVNSGMVRYVYESERRKWRRVDR